MHAVEEAIEITRRLSRWDPAGDDWIKIRQARNLDNARRSKLLTRSMIERERGDTLEREIYDFPLSELQFVECYTTFVDSSLMHGVIENGNRKQVPLFRPNLSEAEFRVIWNGIKEPALLQEWQELVWEVNPHWAPDGWLPTHPEEAGIEGLGPAADTKN